ncbi:type IV secretion protein Rhs [Proteus mirabilis]|nr:type IV secretion protein Rhs [Proteus mirabilis]
MKTYLVYEVPEVGKKNNYTDIDTFDKQWGNALKSDDSLPQGHVISSTNDDIRSTSYIGLPSGQEMYFHATLSSDNVEIRVLDSKGNLPPSHPIYYVDYETYDEIIKKYHLDNLPPSTQLFSSVSIDEVQPNGNTEGIITHVPSSNGKTPEEANTVVSAENNDEKIAATVVGSITQSSPQNSPPSEATQQVYKAFNNMGEAIVHPDEGAKGAIKQFYNDGVEMAEGLTSVSYFYSAITSARNAIVAKVFGFDDIAKNQAQQAISQTEKAKNVDFSEIKATLESEAEKGGALLYEGASLMTGILGVFKHGSKAVFSKSNQARRDLDATIGNIDLTTAKTASKEKPITNVDNIKPDTTPINKAPEKPIDPVDNAKPDSGATIKEKPATTDTPKTETPSTKVNDEKSNTQSSDTGKSQDNQKKNTEGDPVDLVSGDFIQIWPVISIPGLLPIELNRAYYSTQSPKGLFGSKWGDNWSMSLTLHHGSVDFQDPDGNHYTFLTPSDEVCSRNQRVPHYLLLGNKKTGLWIRDNRHQRLYYFEAQTAKSSHYRLIKISNLQGLSLHFRYNDKGQLNQLIRYDGFQINLHYQYDKLQFIDYTFDSKVQRLVSCQYDKQGYLSECDAFQQNHLFHTYTAQGWMTSWRDTDQTELTLEYDTQGRVIKTYSESGYWCDRFLYDDTLAINTYIDNEGGQTRYYYNENQQVIRVLDPLGRETRTQWQDHRKVSETNDLGETTKYVYHADGLLAQIHLPDGRKVGYEYNDNGQLTCYVSPFGDKWQLTYDDKGNLTAVTDPQGRQQAYEYSQHGELLKAIQPNGAQWHYEYNQANQLIKSTSPYQHSSEYQSDELGRLLQVTNALNHTTRYQYSKEHDGVNGSLSDILLPDDIHQHIEYDSERRVVAVTDGEGKTTRYRYGPFDLLLATIRPDGTEIRFEYDSLTRLKNVINATGDVYSYERDKAGQIIREVDFVGREIQYRYDRLERRIATRYPDNHELRYHYDETGLVTEQSIWLVDEIEHKCLSTTTYQYNERLQLIRATNPDSVVEFEYDNQGHLCCERINGQEITHQWDEEHDILTQTRFGERELNYAFGQLHELTSLQVNQHAPLQFSYNALGQEFLRQSQAGFANSSHYTATGLLAHQRAGRGTESFLKSLHDNPLQPPISTDVHRGYQYDKAFNLVNIDDARWNRTQYRYNANDQIVETQYSNQFECQSEKFQYDNNLNITEHQFIPSDAQGAFLQLAQQQQKGRVTRRITAKGYQDYHYDINGRLTQKVVHQHGFRAKTWYYQWNTLNQLTACFNPDGECWRYTYDAFGRRLSKSKVVDNRPITPPNSPFKNKRVQRVDYLWSGDQMVQETPIYADGTRAYDSQIQWLYQPGEITPTARYQRGKLHYVVTDHQGTPREIFSEKGIVSWAGRLNTWGQMAFWQSHDDYADNDPEYTECHFRFAGQYEDKESGLYYNRFRYYDKDTGQYISPDPIGLLGGFNPYGYVHCPTGWVDPFGLSGTRLPKTNGYWDGVPGESNWFSNNKLVNAVTGGKPVPFSNGRPDFSPWSKGSIIFEAGVLDGSRNDFTEVYKYIAKQKGITQTAAKDLLSTNKITPHHFSTTEIILVPTDLHGNVPHIGSASDMRNSNKGKK